MHSNFCCFYFIIVYYNFSFSSSSSLLSAMVSESESPSWYNVTMFMHEMLGTIDGKRNAKQNNT